MKKFNSYSEAYNYYNALDYKDYGWLNEGATPPTLEYRTVYQNYSGSSTLEVNEEFGVMYSVDMGD